MPDLKLQSPPVGVLPPAGKDSVLGGSDDSWAVYKIWILCLAYLVEVTSEIPCPERS